MIPKIINISLLLLSAVLLVALQLEPLGWVVLIISALTLIVCQKKYARDALLLHISLAILGLTPIDTDISYGHMLYMATMLSLALAIPFIVSKYIY